MLIHERKHLENQTILSSNFLEVLHQQAQFIPAQHLLSIHMNESMPLLKRNKCPRRDLSHFSDNPPNSDIVYFEIGSSQI